MILGYVDSEDRVYDLSFATLRMQLRLEAEGDSRFVVFSGGGEPGDRRYRVRLEATASARVAMDHGGHEVPLLRPVEGRLLRHEGGLLFIAEPRSRAPEDPGFFLVQVRAMPSAVAYFFEDREGKEMVSIAEEEVLSVARAQGEVRVSVSAASIALPNETIAYLVAFRLTDAAASLLDGLPMSPGP